MCLDVLIFDLIPVEGNDTFQSEIEAHQGPRSASIRLDPPRVDFHWASTLVKHECFIGTRVTNPHQ